jgi:hypothetical protein
MAAIVRRQFAASMDGALTLIFNSLPGGVQISSLEAWLQFQQKQRAAGHFA